MRTETQGLNASQVTIPSCDISLANRLVIHRHDAWACTQYGMVRDKTAGAAREVNTPRSGGRIERGDSVDWFVYHLGQLQSRDILRRFTKHLENTRHPKTGEPLRYRFL